MSAPTTQPQGSQAVATRLVEFVDALRSKGINAGPSESIDAAAVIEVLGLTDRGLLREGLAAALVRRGGQRDVFDQTFDLFFPTTVGVPEAARTMEEITGTADLRELLMLALADRDLRTLQQIAEIAVDFLGNVGQPDTATAGWSGYQTIDRLQPQTLIAGALAMQGGGSGGGGHGLGTQFTDRLARDEIRQAVAAFEEMVAAEARRRSAELRGRETVTRHAVRTGRNQVDFLSANRQQLEELRRSVKPLSRVLATRLSARRKRRRRGKIDMRRTLRKAMGTGGVPMRPIFAIPRPTRPELVLICDVSGSVAGFSSFTMLLVQALSAQFSKVRVFAFVNAMAEVTSIVRDGAVGGGDDIEPRIRNEARITKWHTSSDYGEAFLDFRDQFLDAVGPRTSVLILGDARNNNQNPRFDALHEIAGRAKRSFWLNPEHHSRWGLGDSVATDYAEIIEMHECSNVEQLTRFVTRLLPV
ncbi:MAG TPA: VWA domain-containing protein [Aeromicrobium sp.]|nr:VWA domain-containing protein [Aeromicrobium sp.]